MKAKKGLYWNIDNDRCFFDGRLIFEQSPGACPVGEHCRPPDQTKRGLDGRLYICQFFHNGGLAAILLKQGD